MLSALLLVNAWSLAPYTHIRPTRHAPIIMQEEADDKPLDMSSLSQRIANIKAAPEPEVVRLLILDSMCPRQRLQLEAPPPLIESIDYHNCSFVMVGSDPRTRQPNPHGVEVTVEQRTDADGGGAIITLAANRLCEVVGVGEAEGSPWLGRAGSVRWIDYLNAESPEEQTTEALLERSKALEELVVDWLKLVRTTGRERSPKQLERVLSDLGPEIPPVNLPSARALWVAALINPLPALGVALEIRPAVLMAETAMMRVQVAEMGIRDSIERLGKEGPLF